jgi:cell division protein FtsB
MSKIIARLRAENEKLQAEVDHLRAENRKLQTELAQLKLEHGRGYFMAALDDERQIIRAKPNSD